MEYNLVINNNIQKCWVNEKKKIFSAGNDSTENLLNKKGGGGWVRLFYKAHTVWKNNWQIWYVSCIE